MHFQIFKTSFFKGQMKTLHNDHLHRPYTVCILCKETALFFVIDNNQDVFGTLYFVGTHVYTKVRFFFSDLTRVHSLKQERRKRTRKFHIVTQDWVRACMEEGSLVNERAYEPSESDS